jgi:hypothetical protein
MDWFYHTQSRNPNQDDIFALINGKIPSHAYLQFWEGNLVSMSDSFLLKLSRQVNAMANHGGGVLILGIKSLRKKAAKLCPILDDNIQTDILHQHILSNNQPFIENLELIPIKLTRGTVLFIRIPSGKAPFMFSDNRYYSFRNQKIEKLEEAGVRSLYQQTKQKQLEIYSIYNTQGIPELENGKYTSMLFFPRILIRNTGNVMESNYKMEVFLPAVLYEDSSHMSGYITRHEGKHVVITYPGKSPLFGQEIHKMLEFKFRVTPLNIEMFEESELRIKLYYSEGVHEQSFSLREIFMYRNQMLKINDFNALK